jgi:hypothetical protein
VLINGQIEIDLSAPAIAISATTAVAVTAPMVTIGASGESLQVLMTKAAHDLLAGHTHSGVSIGGGNTGPMVQGFPTNSLTSILKAG